MPDQEKLRPAWARESAAVRLSEVASLTDLSPEWAWGGSTGKGVRVAIVEVCDKAYFNGSLIVTAANNMSQPSFPSLFASVASVACNMTEDPMRFHWNPDPPTEFLARGIDVDVAWKGGERITSTGNSY